MKTLLLVIVFALLPLVFVNAQDKKVEDARTHQTYTVGYTDVSCPECQGWGWRLGEGFKFSTPGSESAGNTNQATRQKGVSNSSVDRIRCMDCNGTGKISVKYYKPTL